MTGEKDPFGQAPDPSISDADIEAFFHAQEQLQARAEIRHAADAIDHLLDFAEAGDKRLRSNVDDEEHTFSRQFLLESGGNKKYPFSHTRVQGKRKRDFDDQKARSITIRVPDGATDVESSPSYVIAIITRYDANKTSLGQHILTKDGYATWDKHTDKKDRFVIEEGVITALRGTIYEPFNAFQFEAEIRSYEPMTQSTSTDEAA